VITQNTFCTVQAERLRADFPPEPRTFRGFSPRFSLQRALKQNTHGRSGAIFDINAEKAFVNITSDDIMNGGKIYLKFCKNRAKIFAQLNNLVPIKQLEGGPNS